jgi:NhaP-type Na+/H+ or K+/H+ antiporter
VTSIAVFAVAVLLWVTFSKRLEAWSITAPIVLTLVGFISAHALGAGGNVDSERIRELIEITLAVVLFVDASSIAVHWFRTEWHYPARLLGIGLPLTVVLGTVTAAVLFPGNDIWVMAVVGAALAPTDAALGVSIIENERIPLRLRQVVNVESGLNDGLVTPIVSFCIAIAAATVDHVADRPFVAALSELVIGVAAGFVIGAVSGRVLLVARERGWAVPALVPVAPFVVAAVTYLLVNEIGGNGFVAAFVCGVGFGATTRRDARAAVPPGSVDGDADLLEFNHRAAALLGYAVWFLFGESVLGSLTTAHLGLAVGYAVLSLTVLRMVPVALAAIGLHARWDTVLLVGWLGPRGLASIIFAILAADTIGGAPGELVLTVVAVTVAMSVLAHGLSAGPLASWYSKRHPVEPEVETTEPSTH